MKNLPRAILAGVCIIVLAVVLAPTPASAWHQKEFPISGTATPVTPLVLVLNEDQFKGKWKQFKGDLKKKWGNFTDDDLLYIEGSRDKLDGKIQERYGDRREEVKKWIDEWFEENKTSEHFKP